MTQQRRQNRNGGREDGPAITRFILGTKDLEGKMAEFQYDKGWYTITDIVGEERSQIYRSKNAPEAYQKWNVYIGRKKEHVSAEERRKQREEQRTDNKKPQKK